MAHETELNLQLDEVRSIRAALGEVCFGFRVPEFEEVLGGSEQEVRGLFERFDKLSDVGKAVSINISEKELEMIIDAVRETLRELGHEEFHTRTGVSFDSGKLVLARLTSIKSAIS